MTVRRLAPWLLPTVLACLAALATFRGTAGPPAPADKPERPKLAVLVVFDQMRADYLERWKDLFDPDGFARLRRDGAWFTHCHYPYANTATGPGHASILSGCSPDRHGVINNYWYDRGEE